MELPYLTIALNFQDCSSQKEQTLDCLRIYAYTYPKLVKAIGIMLSGTEGEF